MNGKPAISRDERLARLGLSILYGRVVSDYGVGPRRTRPARMGLCYDRGGLRRWRHLRRAPDNFENIVTFLCPWASAPGSTTTGLTTPSLPASGRSGAFIRLAAARQTALVLVHDRQRSDDALR